MIFIRDKWRPAPRHWAVLAFVLVVVLATMWTQGIFTFSNSDSKSRALPAASAPAAQASGPVVAASAISPAPAASTKVTATATVPVPAASSSKPAASSAKTEAKATAKAEIVIAPGKKVGSRPDLIRQEAKPLAAQPAQPASTPVKVWEHWGAAPYAASQEDACRKATEAIDGLTAPEAVKAHFKRQLGTTCEGGMQVWLTPNQHLDQMWSGHDSTHPAPYIMTNVVVAELPVVRAPDGRLYRKGAVAEAAKALSWTFVHEGRLYVLYLPFECFNFSLAAGPAPQAPPPVAMAPPPPPFARSDACPNGWSITANAWDYATLPVDLQREAAMLIAAAESRDSDNGRRLDPYRPDAVSRTMGKRLRERVQIRAPLNATLGVRFLDPKTAKVVKELGTLSLASGMGTFHFQEDPRRYVVELVWPADFVSPANSGGAGRFLRIFADNPNEWGNWCELFAHGLKPIVQTGTKTTSQ